MQNDMWKLAQLIFIFSEKEGIYILTLTTLVCKGEVRSWKVAPPLPLLIFLFLLDVLASKKHQFHNFELQTALFNLELLKPYTFQLCPHNL